MNSKVFWLVRYCLTFSLYLSLFFGLVLTLGCRKMASQNPADSFEDGKFPKQLESLRSQIHEMTVREREAILARIEADKKNPNILKVAIIDSGVHIAHPDLQGQLDYRVENGRIVGAGFDVMGKAASGTHVYVNPTLFAFASKGVRKGKIFGTHQSPLEFLKKMEERLAELVLAGIAQDPVLRTSLFQNVEKDSIHFLQMLKMMESYEGNLVDYKKSFEKGTLFNEATVNNRPEKPGDRSFIHQLTSPWLAPLGELSVATLDRVESIEHGDRFLELLKKSLEQLDREFQYNKRLKQTQTFMQAQKSDVDMEGVTDELEKAFKFIRFGVDAFDPFLVLKSLFGKIPSYRGLPLGLALQKYTEDFEQDLKESLANTDLSDADREVLSKGLKKVELLKQITLALGEVENDAEAYKVLRSRLRRYVYRSQHPFLMSESNDNKHGTHVTATIVRQNPNIRAVPIRVTTSSVGVTPDRMQTIIAGLNQEFTGWLKLPIIQDLILEIQKEYKGLQLSEKAIQKEFKKYFTHNTTNAVFISEVLEAIEIVGREDIKLANVSLGTEFEKSHKISSRVESAVVDLIAEFVRYRMGETMLSKAPHSLFIIATGNDKAWFDGVTRSAFPVGIGSMRLLKVAKEKNHKPSPNNVIQNVLGVASVNPTGTLTGFTNFSIQKGAPQIFSTGEEIMASVPSKSMDAVESLLKPRVEAITAAAAKISDIQRDAFMEDLKARRNIDGESQLTRVYLKQVVTTAVQSLGQLLYLASPITRESMSGTSMATPTVTGELADYVIKKATLRGLPVSTNFASPHFSPATLVSDVMKISQPGPYSEYMIVDVRMLVNGIQVWKKSAGQIETQRAIKQITSGGGAATLRCSFAVKNAQ